MYIFTHCVGIFWVLYTERLSFCSTIYLTSKQSITPSRKIDSTFNPSMNNLRLTIVICSSPLAPVSLPGCAEAVRRRGLCPCWCQCQWSRRRLPSDTLSTTRWPGIDGASNAPQPANMDIVANMYLVYTHPYAHTHTQYSPTHPHFIFLQTHTYT